MQVTFHRLLGHHDGNLTGGSQCAMVQGPYTSTEQPTFPLTPWKVHLAQAILEQ